jgi:hypothetical protein
MTKEEIIKDLKAREIELNDLLGEYEDDEDDEEGDTVQIDAKLDLVYTLLELYQRKPKKKVLGKSAKYWKGMNKKGI